MRNRFDDTNGTLDRLNDALSSLESRIGLNESRPLPQNDLAAIRARQQALNTPRTQMRSAAPHRAMPVAPSNANANADELRAELAQLRADMQREMSGSFSAGVNTLRNDIKSMQQAQATVTHGSASSAAQELRADIVALKADVAQLARQDTINDLMERWSVVEREIGNLPNTLGSRDDILAMADRLDNVQHAVSQLPQDQRMSGLEDQIRVLAMAIEQMAEGNANQALPLDGLNARFDEISRAIAAIPMPETPQPAAGLDAVERIEARISALSRMLENDNTQVAMTRFDDKFAEMADRLNMIQEETTSLRTHASTAFPTELFDRLEDRIGHVADKLDNVAQPQADHGLDDQFAQIAQRIAALHDETASLKSITNSGLPEETLEALGGRIEQLAAAIGENASASSQNDNPQQFEELNTRLQHIAEQLNNNSNAAEQTAHSLISSLDARMDEIARRIDENESRSVTVPSMDALEKRLEDIAQMLTANSAAPSVAGEMPDLSGLENQVAALTQSITGQESAMSQEGLLSAARLAAEEAVDRMSAQAPTPMTDDLTRLAEDLNVLETLARDSDDRNSRTFEAIHDTLLKVVDHLSSLEDTVRTAPTPTPTPAPVATPEPSQAAAFVAPSQESSAFEQEPSTFEKVRMELSDAPSLAPSDIPISQAEKDVEARDDASFEPGSERERPNLSPAHAAAAAAKAAMKDSGKIAKATVPQSEPNTSAKSVLKGLAGKLRNNTPGQADKLDPTDLDTMVGEPDDEQAIAIQNIIADDEPIAPGTGGADLGEIMRRVREERISGGQSAVPMENSEASSRDDSGKSDFIAAARRAAKAAADDATVINRGDDKKTKGTSSLISKLSSNRKPLLIGACAILLAVAAVPIAGKFLSSETSEEQSALQSAVPAIEETDVADNSALNEEEQLGLVEDTIAEPEAEIAEAPEPLADDLQVVDELADASEIADAAQTPSATISLEDIPERVGTIAMREAAANGNGQALYLVGDYFTGGVPGQSENDLATAFLWYKKSAETGYAPAQYRIGNFYEKGFGVARDFAEAKTWYQMAADQGNAAAMHNLAVLYASGADGVTDYTQATSWFKKAADLGVKDSQFNLGILSAQGQGVEQDLVESYKWFAIAAKSGDKDATAKRDEVADALRPDQLELAKGAAELWKVTELEEDKNFVSIPDEWRTDATQTASKPTTPELSAAQMKQAVQNIQAILNQNGFDAGPVDGVMGGKTKTAIMQFQEAHGMTVNGEVTQELVGKLIELNAKKNAS